MDLSLICTVIGVFVLLIISSVLSTAETSVVAASRTKIHKLAKHDKNARLVGALQQRLDQVISSFLIFNSVTNIFATTLTTGMLVAMVGENGVFYATIIMSGLIIFYCEIFPKIFAIQYPEKSSMIFARFLTTVVIVCKPLTRFLHYCARKNLQAIGVTLTPIHEHSPIEEIKGLIEMQSDHSKTFALKRDMLFGVLDLNTTDVRSVMVRSSQVVMLDMGMELKVLVQAALNLAHSVIPIWKDRPDNIVAVLHLKKLLQCLKKVNGNFADVDLNEVTSVPRKVLESSSLYDQLRSFRQHGDNFSLVINESGALQGIITCEDILEKIMTTQQAA